MDVFVAQYIAATSEFNSGTTFGGYPSAPGAHTRDAIRAMVAIFDKYDSRHVVCAAFTKARHDLLTLPSLFSFALEQGARVQMEQLNRIYS